jgi:hypothetical protein
MSLGLAIFTFAHVLISLIGIAAGSVVAYGLLTAKQLDRWTAVFLWTTLLTSVTGFMFPVHKFMPSHVLGIISIVVLGLAFPARYKFRLAGGWRSTYVITAMIAFYLNVFVLVLQLFKRVPVLHVLAPTQSEKPFKVTQIAVLTIFVVVSVLATIRFRAAEQPQLRTA